MNDMSGDAAEQVVRIGIQGAEAALKISGTGAKHLAVLIYSVLKDQQKTSGKTRLINMLKSEKELTVFQVKKDDLAKFSKEAKQYGVLYCVLKDKKSASEIVDVFVRAADAAKIDRIAEKLKYSVVDTSSVISEIEKEKEIEKGGLFIEELLKNPTEAMMESNAIPSSPTLETEEASVDTPTQTKTKMNDGKKKPSIKEEVNRKREQRRNEADGNIAPKEIASSRDSIASKPKIKVVKEREHAKESR